MVRAEIFGFDPMLIWAAAVLGVIVLAVIVLNNEDPLLVLLIGAVICIATLILGNLFEHSVFSFIDNIYWSILTNAPQNSIILMWLVDSKEYVPMRVFVEYTKYILIGVVLFLTLINAYNAFQGGWKTLKEGQFKEK